jgi:subtilisin-like proprotein convertase family protein
MKSFTSWIRQMKSGFSRLRAGQGSKKQRRRKSTLRLLVEPLEDRMAPAVFSNAGAITIPAVGSQGPANPFPSNIAVSGLTGAAIDHMTVTLTNISHTFPADIDVILVGPTGASATLISDVGGGTAATNVTLTLDDAAAAALPDSGGIVSGTFKPTNFNGEDGPDSFPPASLSVFSGTNPNGVWSLYVNDDSAGDTGSIAGGWSLDISTVQGISLFGAPSWVPEGPAPITDGVGNVFGPTTAQSLKGGAINNIAVDPTNTKHVLAATVNGGIWQTPDFTQPNPVWTTTTDRMPSLAIGCVAFSPVSSNVIYAGTGCNSSISNGAFGPGQGGAAVGVYKSIDGGATWQIENPNGIFSGLRIIRIIPTTLNGGQTVFAATADTTSVGSTVVGGGVYRSDDGGASWTRLSTGANTLPNSGVTDLVANPSNANQFFAAIPNRLAAANAGVYRLDIGVSNITWVNVTNDMAAADLATSARIELAISPAGVNPVWASIINTTGFYQRVYRGTVSGSTRTWAQVGPVSGAVNQPPDILTQAGTAGPQGSIHGAIAADPGDDTLVYLSGDKIPSGTYGTAGYVARGDSTANTWTGITPVGTGAASEPGTAVPTSNAAVVTAPHADTRSMVFASGGVLLLTCDGGVYQATSPSTGTQTWTYVGGTIQDTEMYNVAYDNQFNIIFGGAQDNGNPSQNAPGSTSYNSQFGGDGGSTAVDNFSLAGSGESVRYFSGANSSAVTAGGGEIRRLFNGANSRPVGDNDAFILPQAGLAGLTKTTANDLFGGLFVNAVAGRVLVFGAANGATAGALYESSDTGSASETLVGTTYYVNGTWTQITAPAGFAQLSAAAYGGRLNGLDNPDVLYVASGSQIFLRSTSGGALTATAALPAGTGTIVSIALDPNNWQTAFVADATDPGVSDSITHVYMTTDKGAHWITITGNLTNPAGSRGAPAVLSVVPGTGQDAVVFAGTQGVSRMLTNAPGIWTRFGVNQPNAFSGGMVYDTTNDVLVNSTYGRGNWELASASTTVFTAGVLQIDGDADFPGENDTIRLVKDASNPLLLDVFRNSTTPYQIDFSLLQQIDVNGLGGNDTLIVDSSNGLINVPNGIQYDGGTGFNTLQLVQTGGTTQTSDVYSPGPNAGEGTDVITGPGGTQSVFFQNLAPVQDNLPATTATVNGTPADNAISYVQGPGGGIFTGNTGLITVDNLESYEFNNKTNLVLNGNGGTDAFSLNNGSTPAGPLTGIAVNGGDPTNADSLSVNGTASTVSVATNTSTITGAGPVTITYSAITTLSVTAGPSTKLAVSGSTSYIYTPGTAADAGTVQTDSLPISFTGLDATKTLGLTGSGGSASLVANGTAANDTFTVAASNGNVTLAGRATITTTTIANLTLNGLDGDDTFNVTGPQPYTSLVLSGGDPSASDTAKLTGASGTVTVNLADSTIPTNTTITGYGATVTLTGIEVANLDANGQTVTVMGTGSNDSFTVSPTGAAAATLTDAGLNTTFNFTTVATAAGGFSVNGNGGTDQLAVQGTPAADIFDVNDTTSGANAVKVNALLVVNYSGMANVAADGLAGSDTFNVQSSAAVSFSVDGGDPVGVTPGDLINVISSLGDMVNFKPGPTSDSGGFQVNTNQPISFIHIESISVSGGGTPVINGTNGNDVITIIARDSSYAAAADGIQDFTVSVNASPNFLFINTPALMVNALSGNDVVDLVTPALNFADWNVNVTIDGGPPSAPPGDHLTLETPGTNAVNYTPLSPNSGMVVIKGLVNDTTVNIIDVEQFTYNGMAGNDVLTMMGNSSANAFALTPGANPDSGTLSMDTFLPVDFVNLGAAGKVIVDGGSGGVDSLTYYGTVVNDLFTVDSNASPAGGKVTLNTRVPVITTASVQTLTLEGLAGDDTFTLVPTIAASPYKTLNLHGGGQASAAGDQANLTAGASADVTVSGQVVSQSGVTVAGTGLENINLNGAGNRLIYNGIAGVTENINVIGSPTANQGQVSVPGVTLVTFTNVPAFVVNGNPADSDTLAFTGTNNSDTFNINLAAAGTAAAPVLKLQATATSALLLTLQNYTGFQTLNVNGLDSADTFNVFTGPTAPSDPNVPGGRNLFINGNLPTGKKKGTNVLHVFYTPMRPKIVQTVATQNPTAGNIKLDYGTALYLISWAGIQNVTIAKQ